MTVWGPCVGTQWGKNRNTGTEVSPGESVCSENPLFLEKFPNISPVLQEIPKIAGVGACFWGVNGVH